MARRIEGTVAGGFICDASDCSLAAIWSPIVCTPYLIDAAAIKSGEGKPPILNFTDVHVCHHHWNHVKHDLKTDHMREATKSIADQRGGKPDFDKQFLSRIGVHHPDYHRFQEMAGLIPVGDQVIKSAALAPGV